MVSGFFLSNAHTVLIFSSHEMLRPQQQNWLHNVHLVFLTEVLISHQIWLKSHKKNVSQKQGSNCLNILKCLPMVCFFFCVYLNLGLVPLEKPARASQILKYPTEKYPTPFLQGLPPKQLHQNTCLTTQTSPVAILASWEMWVSSEFARFNKLSYPF